MAAPIGETARAREAFEQSWQVLAPNLEQARAVREQSATKPELLNDPNNLALLRWLQAFERQLVALERFHNATATDPSLDLPLGDLQVARQTADDLYNTLQEARGVSSSSAGSAASASAS